MFKYRNFTVVFSRCYLNSSAFFGLQINIQWCTGEYLQRHDGVCGINTKQTTVLMFIVVKEHVTQCNSEALMCV